MITSSSKALHIGTSMKIKRRKPKTTTAAALLTLREIESWTSRQTEGQEDAFDSGNIEDKTMGTREGLAATL
ncbi:unnamed protein product [Linum trigynum]|uniref:Uncharacterized protein n=1 Tax=Linum trigynum TaxID=586398 RepID=A0AAV2DU40_9ROSI